jgi:FixJ family two-component response regulator
MLLDVRMPKMTGVELQALMVKTGDRIPVIFMSGESLPHETLAAQQSNAVTFLWKPFRTEALLNAVSHGLTLYDQLSD